MVSSAGLGSAATGVAAATAAPPRVMLLSVWSGGGPGAAWFARLVQPDAVVHEFHSPFELAQFLAQSGRSPAEGTQRSGGLR